MLSRLIQYCAVLIIQIILSVLLICFLYVEYDKFFNTNHLFEDAKRYAAFAQIPDEKLFAMVVVDIKRKKNLYYLFRKHKIENNDFKISLHSITEYSPKTHQFNIEKQIFEPITKKEYLYSIISNTAYGGEPKIKIYNQDTVLQQTLKLSYNDFDIETTNASNLILNDERANEKINTEFNKRFCSDITEKNKYSVKELLYSEYLDFIGRKDIFSVHRYTLLPNVKLQCLMDSRNQIKSKLIFNTKNVV